MMNLRIVLVAIHLLLGCQNTKSSGDPENLRPDQKPDKISENYTKISKAEWFQSLGSDHLFLLEKVEGRTSYENGHSYEYLIQATTDQDLNEHHRYYNLLNAKPSLVASHGMTSSPKNEGEQFTVSVPSYIHQDSNAKYYFIIHKEALQDNKMEITFDLLKPKQIAYQSEGGFGNLPEDHLVFLKDKRNPSLFAVQLLKVHTTQTKTREMLFSYIKTPASAVKSGPIKPPPSKNAALEPYLPQGYQEIPFEKFITKNNKPGSFVLTRVEYHLRADTQGAYRHVKISPEPGHDKNPHAFLLDFTHGKIEQLTRKNTAYFSNSNGWFIQSPTYINAQNGTMKAILTVHEFPTEAIHIAQKIDFHDSNMMPNEGLFATKSPTEYLHIISKKNLSKEMEEFTIVAWYEFQENVLTPPTLIP